MTAPVLDDAEIAIADERSTKLFGECGKGHGLLEFGCCPICEPEKHAKCREMALQIEREETAKREAARREKNRPNVELAALIETRSNAHQYVTLCRALREGYATDLQIRLARRLTTKKALRRAQRRTA